MGELNFDIMIVAAAGLAFGIAIAVAIELCQWYQARRQAELLAPVPMRDGV